MIEADYWFIELELISRIVWLANIFSRNLKSKKTIFIIRAVKLITGSSRLSVFCYRFLGRRKRRMKILNLDSVLFQQPSWSHEIAKTGPSIWTIIILEGYLLIASLTFIVTLARQNFMYFVSKFGLHVGDLWVDTGLEGIDARNII